MLVANSLPMAPRKKASLGVTLLLLSSTSFNCSKIVYCNIGLMTNTSAGSTPAKRAVGPSVRKRERTVARVEGFFGLDSGCVEGDGREEGSDCRVVIRVLTTQIGLVIRTVAEPAMAPAIIDSTVVSFLEARELFIAARSKKARVHSYPDHIDNISQTTDMVQIRRKGIEGTYNSNR